MSDQQQPIAKDFFIYEIDTTSLAAGGTATGSVAVQADSDFVLQKLTYIADIAGGAITDQTRIIPLVTLQITDTGSGRVLMSAPVPIPNFMGDGVLPFILPQPKLFAARTQISFAFANYSSGTTYNLRLSLIGMKLFY